MKASALQILQLVRMKRWTGDIDRTSNYDLKIYEPIDNHGMVNSIGWATGPRWFQPWSLVRFLQGISSRGARFFCLRRIMQVNIGQGEETIVLVRNKEYYKTTYLKVDNIGMRQLRTKLHLLWWVLWIDEVEDNFCGYLFVLTKVVNLDVLVVVMKLAVIKVWKTMLLGWLRAQP